MSCEYIPSVDDLILLFKTTLPEKILSSITWMDRMPDKVAPRRISPVDCTGKDQYMGYSQDSPEDFSIEERMERYYLLRQMETDHSGYPMGIFGLLSRFSDAHLTHRESNLFCRPQSLFLWNEVCLSIGSDLPVTAFLAWADLRESGILSMRRVFDWRPVLRIDDRNLEGLFEKGLAENHYHLYGSTQSAAVSWIFLMNHPEDIRKSLEKMWKGQPNLTPHSSYGIKDNVWDWEKRIKYAAYIRLTLYERVIKYNNSGKEERTDLLERFHSWERNGDGRFLNNMISAARVLHGCKVLAADGKHYCLDYCMNSSQYNVQMESAYRMLSGERNFLYQCFARCFNGELSKREQELFYGYILIKSHFRQELIQQNKATGFYNFKLYQDRKDKVYDGKAGYWPESLRLSVVADLLENNVKSLECRITPKKTAKEYLKEFRELDRCIRETHMNCNERREFAGRERKKGADSGEQARIGYVIHFVKMEIERYDDLGMDNVKKSEAYLYPRNWRTRKNAEIQAKALEKYLRQNKRGFEDVKGIDAANLEVYCRPEVFATEFRFLTGLSQSGRNGGMCTNEASHKLGMTYHVGEDFIDIINGIRAVDEAIRFLNLGQGSRIGHGMALGIDADDYYRMKRNMIVIRKQDRLDDLVWMLFFSRRLNIHLNSDWRLYMKENIIRLLEYIYGHIVGHVSDDVIRCYYGSWKLRGDHPDIYRCNLDSSEREAHLIGLGRYSMSKAMEGDELQRLRNDSFVFSFANAYHFDPNVKMKGQETEYFDVPDWYPWVVCEMQRAMRSVIAEKGIVIECNPTSNYLIGAFKDYTKHPMFVFNRHGLDGSVLTDPQLKVTINTDDIGIFATSLANEYALTLMALKKNQRAIGNKDEEAVYEYLEMIRKNGFEASFV